MKHIFVIDFEKFELIPRISEVFLNLLGIHCSSPIRAGMVSDQTLCLLSPKEVPKLKSNILSLIIKTTTTAIYGRYYCGSALPQFFDIGPIQTLFL